MMDLSPLEVRQKRGDFPRVLRGYDPGHVDDFLALVADRLETVVKENLALRERAGRLEEQVSDFRDREGALTEALVTAQELREEVRRQSSREAELLREEARHDAERIRGGALLATEREEEILRRLRARQAQLIRSYRSFLEREIAELAVVAETLSLEVSGAADARERPERRGGEGRAAEEGSGGDSFAAGIAALAGSGPAAGDAAAGARPEEGAEPRDAEPSGEDRGGGAHAERARLPWEQDEGDAVEAHGEPEGADPWADTRELGPAEERGVVPAEADEVEGERGGPDPDRDGDRRDPSPENGEVASPEAGSSSGPAGGAERDDEPDWLASLLREP